MQFDGGTALVARPFHIELERMSCPPLRIPFSATAEEQPIERNYFHKRGYADGRDRPPDFGIKAPGECKIGSNDRDRKNEQKKASPIVLPRYKVNYPSVQ